MKPVGLSVLLTFLLAIPFGSQALAEDAWPALLTGVKATATLTYTDTGMGKKVKKNYKPIVNNFKIARSFAADASDHKTTFDLTDVNGMTITASTFGTGRKTAMKTEVIGVWDKDQEDPVNSGYIPFDFNDPFNGISMHNADMISVSSQGTYTENTKDTTIVLSMKYTIMGTVTAAGVTFPAKLVVQVSGSKLPKVTP